MSILDKNLEDNKYIELKDIVRRRFFHKYNKSDKLNSIYHTMFDILFDEMVYVDNDGKLNIKDYYKIKEEIRIHKEHDNKYSQFSMDVFYLDFNDILMDCILFMNDMQLKLNSLPMIIVSDRLIENFPRYKVKCVHINELDTLIYGYYNKDDSAFQDTLFNINKIKDLGASIQTNSKNNEHILSSICNMIKVKCVENFHLSIFGTRSDKITRSSMTNIINSCEVLKLTKMPIKNLSITMDDVFAWSYEYDKNKVQQYEYLMEYCIKELYSEMNNSTLPFKIKVTFRI